MAAAVQDSLLDLENHRLKLEENIANLRKSLQHWQSWDAEYEALKEEVDALPAPVSQKDLARIRRDYEGELVNKREVNEIFGKIDLRPAERIINLLERRIDYVTKNIETLEKQLEGLETQLAAATVVSNPSAADDDGVSITEIIEELDNDDNVLSYQLRTQGDSVPRVREILEKAGITELPTDPPSSNPEFVDAAETEDKGFAKTNTPPASQEGESTVATKKSVSFSEDTTAGHASDKSFAAQRVEAIMQSAKAQEGSVQQPVIPADESEDDAALRREMLQYSMGEVGEVVAELIIEEGSDDDDDGDDDYEVDYTDEDEDEDGDEDKYGRSTQRIITNRYRERMLELEKRLGVKSRFTAEQPDEPDDDSDEATVSDEGIGRIVVDRSVVSQPSTTPNLPAEITENPGDNKTEAKKVRFAANLDVAPAKANALPVERSQEPAKQLVDPLNDVVERSGPSNRSQAASTRKASRFKKNRTAEMLEDPIPSSVSKGPLDVPVRFLDQERPTAPSGPKGLTLASSIVERGKILVPENPEELDDILAQQEVADEYHRKRRNFIHREGGFMKEDESPVRRLDEEEGGPERMSRFKAARLSKQ
jgi:unconventional prefoldin RPB5 interactor 1